MNQTLLFTRVSQLDKKTSMLAGEVARTQMRQFAELKTYEARKVVAVKSTNWFRKVLMWALGLEVVPVLDVQVYEENVKREAKLYADALNTTKAKPNIVLAKPGEVKV